MLRADDRSVYASERAYMVGVAGLEAFRSGDVRV
jgi:hypothetical protein